MIYILKKEVTDEHGCLVLSLLPSLKADFCLLKSALCILLPPARSPDNAAFGLSLALNHISFGTLKKKPNTLSNQPAMKISINWDILEIIHALWRGLGAGTDNCTVSKVCESSKPKYRRTAFVLPTNSRICAVLDRENPVLRTVLNSWLKAGVHSIFSECRHRSLGSLRMFCSYFASLPPCSPVPIPSCPQLALLL